MNLEQGWRQRLGKDVSYLKNGTDWEHFDQTKSNLVTNDMNNYFNVFSVFVKNLVGSNWNDRLIVTIQHDRLSERSIKILKDVS